MNQKEIFVIAIRRSGQHAVMNWIESLIDEDDVITLNNITDDTKKAYRDLKKQYNKKPFSKIWDKEYLLYNSEDTLVGRAENLARQRVRRDIYGYSFRNPKKVVIVRNHFNLFASRLKPQETKPSITKSIGVMTEEIMHYYNNHCLALKDPQYIPVVYDKWFQSKDYRKEVAQKLELESNIDREEINKVSKFGNGSSFNGLDYDNNAQQMDVLNRYESYTDNKKYIKFATQPELIQCYKDIFGEDETYNRFMELK